MKPIIKITAPKAKQGTEAKEKQYESNRRRNKINQATKTQDEIVQQQDQEIHIAFPAGKTQKKRRTTLQQDKEQHSTMDNISPRKHAYKLKTI